MLLTEIENIYFLTDLNILEFLDNSLLLYVFSYRLFLLSVSLLGLLKIWRMYFTLKITSKCQNTA